MGPFYFDSGEAWVEAGDDDGRSVVLLYVGLPWIARVLLTREEARQLAEDLLRISGGTNDTQN